MKLRLKLWGIKVTNTVFIFPNTYLGATLLKPEATYVPEKSVFKSNFRSGNYILIY